MGNCLKKNKNKTIYSANKLSGFTSHNIDLTEVSIHLWERDGYIHLVIFNKYTAITNHKKFKI